MAIMAHLVDKAHCIGHGFDKHTLARLNTAIMLGSIGTVPPD